MHRRRVLHAVGAGVVPLAGCSGVGEPTTTPDPRLPAVRVETAGVAPVEAVSVGVTVTSEFTESSPAELRVGFTNDADESRSFRFGHAPPFSDTWTERRGGEGESERGYEDEREGEGELALFAVDAENVPADRSDAVPDAPVVGCWQISPEWTHHLHQVTHRRLDPGETLARQYVLLAAPDGPCLPPGRYPFRQDDYADSGESWGFTVVLE